MKQDKFKLTLDRPTAYKIKVPGHLGDNLVGGTMRITLAFEGEGTSQPITSLTCVVDQAALHGLSRQLYSLGVPLISVICVEGDLKEE